MDEPTGDEQPLIIRPEMLLSRRLDFERRMDRAPRATLVIIGVLVAVFALEVAMDALDTPQTLVAMGALSRPAVVAGQYWRMITATLLHGSVGHLAGNAVALYILGMVCEHAFGRAQFVLLYAASAVAGSLLSTIASPGPSVGASGAIFGLQAAAIVLFRAHRDRLLVRDRRIGFVLLVWAAYSVISGIATPYIDNGAHVGGAIGGALVARRLHPVVLDWMPEAKAATVARWLWVVAAAGAYAIIGAAGSFL
jgi:rhomboid protease GluP